MLARQIARRLRRRRPRRPTVIVAYEPVWAIGTGVAATPDDAQQAIGLIRGQLRVDPRRGIASGVRILYGGSVTADKHRRASSASRTSTAASSAAHPWSQTRSSPW